MGSRRASSAAELRNRRRAADFCYETIGKLGMPRYRFPGAGHGIAPERMCRAFSLQIASVSSEMGKQALSSRHGHRLPLGIVQESPRAFSRRSCSIKAIAGAKLSRASCFVCPWPLAPGISGQ